MIAGLRMGEGQHRGVRRRSEQRDDLRRVGGRHRRQHARGVAAREGSVPPRDLGERRLVRAVAPRGRKAASACRRSQLAEATGQEFLAQARRDDDRRGACAARGQDPAGAGPGLGERLLAGDRRRRAARRSVRAVSGEALQRHAGADRHELRRRRAVHARRRDERRVRSADPRRLRRARGRDSRRVSARHRRRSVARRAQTSSATRRSRGPRGRGRACSRRRARARRTSTTSITARRNGRTARGMPTRSPYVFRNLGSALPARSAAARRVRKTSRCRTS